MKIFYPSHAFFILFFLTSCAIYQQDFDSSPPLGISCTSETDLESMVVETKKGPDLFVPIEREIESKTRWAYCKSQDGCATLNRKVWICHHLTDDGCCIQGHYIYQTPTDDHFNLNTSPDLTHGDEDLSVHLMTN
jgi:hypothetical protein